MLVLCISIFIYENCKRWLFVVRLRMTSGNYRSFAFRGHSLLVKFGLKRINRTKIRTWNLVWGVNKTDLYKHFLSITIFIEKIKLRVSENDPKVCEEKICTSVYEVTRQKVSSRVRKGMIWINKVLNINFVKNTMQ